MRMHDAGMPYRALIQARSIKTAHGMVKCCTIAMANVGTQMEHAVTCHMADIEEKILSCLVRANSTRCHTDDSTAWPRDVFSQWD